MVPLGLAVVVAGGWILGLACWLVSIAMNWELHRLINRKGRVQSRTILTAVLSALLFLGMHLVSTGPFLLWTLAGAVLASSAGLWVRKPILSGLAFLYATLPPLAFFALREGERGALLLVVVLLLVWTTDIAAYFAGRGFGGPRLAPTRSPNKTWSGCLGALICTGLLGAAIGGFLQEPVLPWAIIALCASVVAQLGDLFESAIKRWANVKDSSQLIPGHGGVLDRLDSLMAASLFFYLVGALAPSAWLPYWGLS
jgi:phosphatidate cytidylyltransferase